MIRTKPFKIAARLRLDHFRKFRDLTLFIFNISIIRVALCLTKWRVLNRLNVWDLPNEVFGIAIDHPSNNVQLMYLTTQPDEKNEPNPSNSFWVMATLLFDPGVKLAGRTNPHWNLIFLVYKKLNFKTWMFCVHCISPHLVRECARRMKSERILIDWYRRPRPNKLCKTQGCKKTTLKDCQKKIFVSVILSSSLLIIYGRICIVPFKFL